METLTIHSPEDSFLENTMTAEAKILERIENPPEGGRLAHFRSHSYPEKYIPTPMRIYLVDSVKRTLMACLKLNWRLVLAIKQEKTLKELLWHSLRHISFKSQYIDKYCTSGREIYRTGIKTGFDEKWVHIMTLIWEYDNAWRYRLQSLLPLIKQFTVKGLRELIKLGSSWEQDKSIAKKWLMIRTAVLILYLMPKFRKNLFKFLQELNMKNIRLSEEDKYWCYHWGIFDFGGLSFEKRLNIREMLKQAK